MAAFTAPIDVPAAISILIFFFTNALNTPHANAPREPPPCNTRTFSIFLDFLCCGWLVHLFYNSLLLIFIYAYLEFLVLVFLVVALNHLNTIPVNIITLTHF